MTACGGGGGSTQPPPPVVNDSPGGIWFGIDSDGGVVSIFVTETGRFQFLTEFFYTGSGILSVSNGNDVTGNFQLVTQIYGPSFPDGTTLADCTLSGTVTERQTMSIIVNCTTTAGLQDQITVTPLDYLPIYERDSSLATIAGMYMDFTVVIDIGADGTIFAQDAFTGCITNGQVSIIDPDFNVYDFQFGYSNCIGPDAFLNGSSFVGIAILDDTFPPEVLDAPAIGDVGGTLLAWATFGERL